MCTPISRRGLFAASGLAGLAGVAGCARLVVSTDAPPAAPPITASPAGPAPMPTPTPSPTPPAPCRAAIVARYAGRAPREWSSDEVSGLVRRTPGEQVVLTFDGCGGAGGNQLDRDLIDLLRRERIPAVLFLNKRWIEANRAAVDALAEEPELFDLGNHGTRHVPLSVTGRSAYGIAGTRDAGEVFDEVMGNHAFMTELLGTPPRYFRTGTAWYDDVAVAIVRELGEIPIGFDINGDGGATFTAAQVAQETGRARAGSIVIAHLNQPQRQTFEGMRQVLPRLRDQGVRFARLSQLGVS